MSYIKKLISMLDKKSKRHFLWLVALSIFVSIIETIGISAIMPFIDIATNFDNIHENEYYQRIYAFFGFDKEVNFAIAFGLALFVFYFFRAGVNLFYSYVVSNFSQGLYAKMTEKLFKTYIRMPYQVFVTKNSSYLTKAIISEAALMSGIVQAMLLMISEFFIVIFLYILILIVNWKITIIFTVILIIKLFLLTKTISKKIKKIGVIRAEVQATFYEIINRLFGNFKHIKLQDNNRLEWINCEFSLMVNKYAKVNAKRLFLSSMPKIFLETSGFSLIVFLLIALLYLNQSNVMYILPTLSLFVLALYRLLPSVNRILNSYNTLMYGQKSIDIFDKELQTTQESVKNEVIKFNKKIELEDVYFSHQKELVLKSISLTINKGDKIALVGESGSGKSTLVDLIIGLYQPNQGKVKVDGILINESNVQNWRSQVGYIPQQVYLFDGTIAENICFGRKLNRILLKKVLKQADIFDFLQTKRGSETLVGEGGVQLSGGQKQRVAIARALYGEPEILVLDEATSALDSETEKKIMNNVYRISQDKTLIVIAHRLSTIKDCNKIYKVNSGEIVQ
jgi:ATP-binding cassette subfamily B protein